MANLSQLAEITQGDVEGSVCDGFSNYETQRIILGALRMHFDTPRLHLGTLRLHLDTRRFNPDPSGLHSERSGLISDPSRWNAKRLICDFGFQNHGPSTTVPCPLPDGRGSEWKLTTLIPHLKPRGRDAHTPRLPILQPRDHHAGNSPVSGSTKSFSVTMPRGILVVGSIAIAILQWC